MAEERSKPQRRADREAAIERHGLEGEQAQLVRSLTSSGDAIHVVRAPAGAGKTHSLEAAKEAWVRSGAEVTGCALSARAATELGDHAALETTTIARLRVALDLGHRLPLGGVLIVDEAAMVGTRVDRSFVLGSDELCREWGYIAMSRHLEEARFYIDRAAPHLNRPARSLERQEELVEAVARLFETTQQQELALEALERTPGAAQLLERMDRAATSAQDAAAQAEVLAAEHDLVPRFHRSRRREFELHADRCLQVAEHHGRQLANLADAFDRLASGDGSAALARPASDPVDLGGLPGPELDLDVDLSPGM